MWGLKLHGSQRDICRSGFKGPNTLWDWSGFLCFSLYLGLWMLLCLLYLKRTSRSKAFSNGFNHKLTSQCFASPLKKDCCYTLQCLMFVFEWNDEESRVGKEKQNVPEQGVQQPERKIKHCALRIVVSFWWAITFVVDG